MFNKSFYESQFFLLFPWAPSPALASPQAESLMGEAGPAALLLQPGAATRSGRQCP